MMQDCFRCVYYSKTDENIMLDIEDESSYFRLQGSNVKIQLSTNETVNTDLNIGGNRIGWMDGWVDG